MQMIALIGEFGLLERLLKICTFSLKDEISSVWISMICFTDKYNYHFIIIILTITKSKK